MHVINYRSALASQFNVKWRISIHAHNASMSSTFEKCVSILPKRVREKLNRNFKKTPNSRIMPAFNAKDRFNLSMRNPIGRNMSVRSIFDHDFQNEMTNKRTKPTTDMRFNKSDFYRQFDFGIQ